MNAYSFDTNVIDKFVEQFHDIYQNFMDFGGIIYNDADETSFEYIFREYPKKHKIEAATRLAMLRKLSKYINDEDTDIFNNILELNSVGGECGLSNTINTLPVFEDDPLHKKGNLLIQILLREGLVSVDDEYNVAPSIDYHVIRFFLRNGFIKFADETIINRLIKRLNLMKLQN